jgi:hypothetical protein
LSSAAGSGGSSRTTCEEFLPSAYAMIVSLVVIILGVVTVTDSTALRNRS